jgi:type I restriction enzyme S subunit
LDCELQARNTAITRTDREIALMQEYRTRLTADIVTGKLDVREAAAKLPEGLEGEAEVAGLEEMDEDGFDAGSEDAEA